MTGSPAGPGPQGPADYLYRREGRTSSATWVTGFWLFLPVVGSLVWHLTAPAALNDFWLAHGAPRP